MLNARNEGEDVDAVEVRITIAARVEVVFGFVSTPEGFARWMGNGSVFEPKPGGNVQVAYPNGDIGAGHVEELETNRRVVFSWGYQVGDQGIPAGSTRVEISLASVSAGTRVTLRQTGLRAASQRAGHRAGWRHYLAALALQAVESVMSGAPSVIEAYTRAWNLSDAGQRSELLEKSWAEGGVFRDPIGYVEDRGGLHEYIGMAQQFSPGLTLEVAGPITRSHSFVAYRWRICAADGAVILTGTNAGELDEDGRLRSMTGFWDMPEGPPVA